MPLLLTLMKLLPSITKRQSNLTMKEKQQKNPYMLIIEPLIQSKRLNEHDGSTISFTF